MDDLKNLIDQQHNAFVSLVDDTMRNGKLKRYHRSTVEQQLAEKYKFVRIKDTWVQMVARWEVPEDVKRFFEGEKGEAYKDTAEYEMNME